MKITKCENRFEVIVTEQLGPEEARRLIENFESWVLDRQLPSDEDYLAALGPCGK